jgi:micrococcal nuclease
VRITRVRGLLGSVLLFAVVAAFLLSDPGDDPAGPGRRAEPGADPVRALVTRVIDGDTVEVRIGGRSDDVRYIGVDTPETVKPGTPVQCFGPQASAYNHRLVEGRPVRLDFDRERRDVYGRLLAYVHLRDGAFVNAQLVRLGYARTLTIPPNIAHAGLFHRLARVAGRAGRGLWGAC